jgi:hypothetical protein
VFFSNVPSADGANFALAYFCQTEVCRAWPFEGVTPQMVLDALERSTGVLTSVLAARDVCDFVSSLPQADAALAPKTLEVARDLLLAAIDYQSFQSATIEDKENLFDYVAAWMGIFVDDFGPQHAEAAVEAATEIRRKLGKSETMDDLLESMLDP